MNQDLRIAPGVVVPAEEIRWRFDTSGGPGGQHANRSATRVEAAWDLHASRNLDPTMRRRLLEGLGAKAAGGVLVVAAGDTRSQWRNRAIARRRLAEAITAALHQDRDRVATTPFAGSRRRRVEAKRRRSAIKRMRGQPDEDE